MSNRDEFESELENIGGFSLDVGGDGEYRMPSTFAAWRIWQAARAQGGEAVAKVTVSESPGGYCGAYVGIEWLNKDRVLEGDLLYRGLPQSAQQGSVPEPFGTESAYQEAKGRPMGSNMNISCALVTDLVEALRATTPQPADTWIKCSERLPTEADADFEGGIYTWNWKTKAIHKLQVWAVLERLDVYSLWMPTGLKRPNPPAEQEGE